MPDCWYQRLRACPRHSAGLILLRVGQRPWRLRLCVWWWREHQPHHPTQTKEQRGCVAGCDHTHSHTFGNITQTVVGCTHTVQLLLQSKWSRWLPPGCRCVSVYVHTPAASANLWLAYAWPGRSHTIPWSAPRLVQDRGPCDTFRRMQHTLPPFHRCHSQRRTVSSSIGGGGARGVRRVNSQEQKPTGVTRIRTCSCGLSLPCSSSVQPATA